MATSFEGWLSSWKGWGTQAFDPNAMQGTALMTFSAIGVLTATGAVKRGSGTASKRKQSYIVDRFSDWPIKPQPRKSDDEECLMLLMI